MSLYGALFSGVSTLSAQSQSIGMISDNIANVNTVGFKRREAAFESLVTTQTRSTAFSPGAVRTSTLQRIDQQGIIQQSRSATDLAISGNGFFVVQDDPTDTSAEPLYTRAGQFSENSEGFLVNVQGKYLMGWPLDVDGNIPASSGDLSSLVPVDVAFLGGVTRPTTTAEMALNLQAVETPYVYPTGGNAVLASSTTPHFTRSIRVFDSLGVGQDLTLNFTHHTSPTATAAGSVDVESQTGNIFDEFGSINSTATYDDTATNPVDLTAAGTWAANGFTNGDSFVMEFNGEEQTITITNASAAIDDATDGLVALINNAFTGTPASLSGGGQIVLGSPTAITTQIDIRQGGSQPMSQSQIQSLGLDFGVTDRDDVTFVLDVTGGVTPQTVSISEGDTINDLVASINALDGINAQLDADGKLVIAADLSGANLTISGVGGGAPEISTAGLSQLGLSAITYTPPATAPNLLTPLDNVANPQNWWQIEVVDTNGIQLELGSINFNGDGTINSSDDPILLSLTNIDWGNGSELQNIELDATAFSQFSGDYNVVYTNQNGAELGLRTGISVSREGIVTAQFSNGEQTDLYKLAIATFANSNGLTSQTGNVFQESQDSGEYNLREAGAGGAGDVESGALEASNVDLADEFSKMIVTQRAYSAGTRVISTADQMLDDLLRLR